MSMNTVEVRKVIKESPDLRKVLSVLVTRERSIKEMSIPRLQAELHEKGFSFALYDLAMALKELELGGVGKVKMSEAGAPTHFKWALPMHSFLEKVGAKGPDHVIKNAPVPERMVMLLADGAKVEIKSSRHLLADDWRRMASVLLDF